MGRNWLNTIKLDWNSVINPTNIHIHNTEMSQSIATKVKSLLKKHATIFSDKLGKMKGFQAKLHMKDTAIPKFSKARSIPFALEEAVNIELQRLEDEGILKPLSFSEWASPILVVTKPNGTIRICGDFKRPVNPIIENEEYLMPIPEELFTKLQGGKEFSKIDLSKAYLQIELHEQSQKYLIINTTRGLKKYLRMPYGIKPASGIFQKQIENCLKDIPKTIVRIDDILVTGEDDDEHLGNLTITLHVLADLVVTANYSNCIFFVDKVDYMGHIISKNRVCANVQKVEAILQASPPMNVKEVEGFF